MTRINLLPPEHLTDQHLMREYQELPRIFGNVRKAILAKKTVNSFKIPVDYVLGTGHMTFFYNKLEFLRKRQNLLIEELLKRSYKINFTEGLSTEEFHYEWLGDYSPTSEGISLSKERILEKIMEKPSWYKYYGISITDKDSRFFTIFG